MIVAACMSIFWLGGTVITGIATLLGFAVGSLAYKTVALAVTIALAGAFVAGVFAILSGLTGYINPPLWLRIPIAVLVPPHFLLFATAILAAKFYKTVYKFAKFQLTIFGGTKWF